MGTFHEKLLAIGRPVAFPAGARLVRQGEAARGAFLIGQGEAEALVALPGGGMLSVARLGEGEMFGEMALLEHGVCSASVLARTAVQGWFVARSDFAAMTAVRDPGALEVQRAITRALVARLRALNAKVLAHPAQAEPFTLPETTARVETPPSFDWRAFLPVLPFFEGFDAQEIEQLADAGRAHELPRGVKLFAAGEPSRAGYLVVRGALEVFALAGGGFRRIAIAGPGELVGILSLLERKAHGASAWVREAACVLEVPAQAFLRWYDGQESLSVRLQRAIHRSLLRSLARTNTQLARLISAARLSGAQREGDVLTAAYSSQIVAAEALSPESAA
ncbi:MAG TPA: cyclic nucleotide-binding domain-containing protein [Burkholderiales bacterium]|nr:cyclic nucleotide-binding domain-containing protein [Burkholderiales bacterium]